MEAAESSRSRTRSGQDLQIQIKDVKFYKADPLDHTKPQMLPTYGHLYQRFLTVKAELGGVAGAWDSAVELVATEFIYDWVMMNIYTISTKSVIKKFDKLLKEFDYVKRWPVAKRETPAYHKKADSLLATLDHGVDIFCKVESSRKHQEKEYGVKMTEQEHMMYTDNCIPIVKDWTAACPRKVCTAGVDSKWLKEAQDRQIKLEKKLNFAKRRKLRLDREAEQTKKLVGDEARREKVGW